MPGHSIGFDAKRAFLNKTGLGNYSRTLLNILQQHGPENRYLLYAAQPPDPEVYQPSLPVRTPSKTLNKITGALWRSRGLVPNLHQDDVQIYHGLSNELPIGLRKAGIRTVVTIHDLIFMRRPEGYQPIDRWVYTRKLKHAVAEADCIVAISEQTRQDILELTGADPDRVSVIYQNCQEVFREKVTEEARMALRSRYTLPHQFVLHVGGWNPRKNLVRTIDAIATLPTTFRPVLVALGAEPRPLASRVEVMFLPNVAPEDLPALFQAATALVYPSLYEGFGLPVLEAMVSGTPALTSPGGSMEEVAKDAALYADPHDIDSLAEGLRRILLDSALRQHLITAGRARAAWFAPKRIAEEWLELYDGMM